MSEEWKCLEQLDFIIHAMSVSFSRPVTLQAGNTADISYSTGQQKIIIYKSSGKIEIQISPRAQFDCCARQLEPNQAQ